jgi:hypothetical protein
MHTQLQKPERKKPLARPGSRLLLLLMAVQPSLGSGRIFQLLKLVHSRWGCFYGGSPRRKASPGNRWEDNIKIVIECGVMVWNLLWLKIGNSGGHL